MKYLFLTLLVGLFVAVISVTAQSSLSHIKFETEDGAFSQNVSEVTDSNASGSKAILFSDSQEPSSERPTRDNTGPRFTLTNITPDQFFNSRTCDRQRINGDVRFDQSWMKAQTFTLTDCEITGNVWIYIQAGGAQLPLSDMPIINLDYVDINGGIIAFNAAKLTIDHSYFAQGGQVTLKDYWAPFITGPAPITIRNTVFYHPPGNAANGDHVEALHIADYGSGWQFINVAFVQQGPMNGTQTATINFHGSESVFDGCWFLWGDDGSVAAFTVVYIDGSNNVVKNSWFASGATYVYPDYAPNMQATYINNRNVDTGELLVLP